jgi:hypothetical protein
LLAGNKPLKEAKGRFKISIDALYENLQSAKVFKPCGTRHRFSNPIKYPGHFMEWIKNTGNKQLSTL